MNDADKKLFDLTLALAGIFQTASLVRDLSQKGSTDEHALQTSINSIYKIDAANVTEVYGDLSGLRLGLKELLSLLGNEKSTTDPQLSRYVISILHLERRLMKNQSMRDTLVRRINYAASQAKYFSATHSTVMASLADAYLGTLGTLSFRIQILGHAKYLQQQDVINKIRALLLAGVRSAVLWRQLGGSRWQLFLWRTKLANTAKQILRRL